MCVVVTTDTPDVATWNGQWRFEVHVCDVVRCASQLRKRMARSECVNDGLSAVMGLVFGECKGSDMFAVGRDLAYVALTVELESSDAQSVLLR